MEVEGRTADELVQLRWALGRDEDVGELSMYHCMLCCAVLCCAVLCGAVLCCAVRCGAVCTGCCVTWGGPCGVTRTRVSEQHGLH